MKFLPYLLCFFLTTAGWAQSQQKTLELRKAQIQKEIRENERQLQKVRSKEKTTKKAIALHQKRILLKERLINTTADQIMDLDSKISYNQTKIDNLNQDLVSLSKDYAQMIVKSYKSRSEHSRLMFILSSENFTQAYKRIQYMKQYANFRRMQGQEISRKMRLLNEYVSTLNSQKTEKQKLVEDNEKERNSLQKEKKEQEKYASTLKKEKKQIQIEIKKKQAEARQIAKKIDKLIRDAIAEANRQNAAKAANTKGTKAVAVSSAVTMSLTPDLKIVSDNFKLSKGKLPWPVEYGYISLGYGNQAHPIFNTLIVHNSGLEITTNEGSDARAVFQGVVVSVLVLSATNKAVMIQHGDFFTVYQNLSSVNVGKGDRVSIKESLGRIKTNPLGKAVLKFMLTQNTAYQNPNEWLARK